MVGVPSVRVFSVLLPLLFGVGAALADEGCDEFRLDGPGGPMEHVAVRDQDTNGICYAASIAQFYDALRFGEGGDRNYAHQTSSLFVANLYKENGSHEADRNEAFHAITSIDSAYTIDYESILRVLANGGSCSEAQIEGKLGVGTRNPRVKKMFFDAFIARFFGTTQSEPMPYSSTERDQKTNEIYARFTETVRNAKKSISEGRARTALQRELVAYDRAEQSRPHLDNYAKLYQDRRNAILSMAPAVTNYAEASITPTAAEMRTFSNLLHKEFEENQKKGAPLGQTPRTLQYLDSLSRSHADVILKDYGEFLKVSSLLTCPQADRARSPAAQLASLRVVQLKREDPDPKNPKPAVRRIAEVFRQNEKRYPAVVSSVCFPFQHLTPEQLRKIAASKSPVIEDDDCGGGHTFLVIGQRKNAVSGKCEYLIRNSWGKDVYYAPGWYTEGSRGVLGVDVDLLERLSDHALSVLPPKLPVSAPSKRPGRG